MIHDAIESWHRVFRGLESPDAILAEGCTFSSPVVFGQKRGRTEVAALLGAAHRAFVQLPADGSEPVEPSAFRYVRTIVDEPHAVLEFKCQVDGISINGVDILTADGSGKLTDVTVMIRPLKGLRAAAALMAAQLASDPGSTPTDP